jgi:hypothetical protein
MDILSLVAIVLGMICLLRCVFLESVIVRLKADHRRQIDALYSKYFLLLTEYEREKKAKEYYRENSRA